MITFSPAQTGLMGGPIWMFHLLLAYESPRFMSKLIEINIFCQDQLRLKLDHKSPYWLKAQKLGPIPALGCSNLVSRKLQHFLTSTAAVL